VSAIDTTATTGESMSDNAGELLEAVRQLPEDERAELAAQVMESFEPLPDDDEFAEEIRRRVAQVESGEVKTIPGEVVRKRLRDRL
jgi:putative addiction module component (TIGR02574 family)